MIKRNWLPFLLDLYYLCHERYSTYVFQFSSLLNKLPNKLKINCGTILGTGIKQRSALEKPARLIHSTIINLIAILTNTLLGVWNIMYGLFTFRDLTQMDIYVKYKL